MMRVIILVLLGNILLFGLYLFIGGSIKNIKEISFKKNLLLICLDFGATIFAAIFIERFDIVLVLLMLIEGIILLREAKQEYISVKLIKSIGYIMVMIIVELIGLYCSERHLEKEGHFIRQYYGDVVINLLLLLCLTALLLLCVYQMYQAKRKRQKGVWVLVGIRIILEIITLHIGVFLTFEKGLNIRNALLGMISIFADYLIYVVVVCMLENTKESEQDQRQDIRMNSYEYYTNMEEEQRKVRKMYHDMKNQIMIYENTEGLKDVFSPMLDKLKAMERFHYTGCRPLDMLLFNGERLAKDKGIEFEAVISEGCFSFMKDEDVSVIFSNAIMNAMEACEKINAGPKKIQIKAGANKGDVMLYIKNSVSTERSKGRFATDKSDKKSHGIGLTSIREIVEKYDGYISVIEEDSTVQLAIIFAGKEKYGK